MTTQKNAVANYTELTIADIPNILEFAFEEHTNLFLIGDPGLGKTQVIGQFARKLAAKHTGTTFTTFVASMLDRLDIAGLPFRNDKGLTSFALMEEIAMATVEHNADGAPHIIYLNEVNSAPDSVQPVLLRLLSERSVGGCHLRDNVMLVADGNHATTSRIAKEMPEPSKRRFEWIHLRVDKKVWIDYAFKSDCDARVIAFIQAHSSDGVLSDFQSGEARGRVTYACPASWSRLGKELNRLMARFDSRGLIFQAWVDGCVGAGVGKQFCAFLEHQNSLPDIKETLLALSKAKTLDIFPDKMDVQYMFLVLAANLVIENPTSEILGAALKTAVLLIDVEFNGNKLTEHSVFFLRSLLRAQYRTEKGDMAPIRDLIVKNMAWKDVVRVIQNDKALFSAIQESAGDAPKQ
jgi:hypothetical protein